MKTISDFILFNGVMLAESAQKSTSEKLAELFMKDLEKSHFEKGVAQEILENFLRYLMDSTDKDTNIEIGDAINNIYKEYIA